MRTTAARFAAMVAVAFAPGAAAEEIELRFATLDAPVAHHIVNIHIPAARRS